MAEHKYAQVRDHLLRRASELPVGTRLPSEPKLCEEYEVSRITVRRAMDELVGDGHLVREHGRGTFVSRPRYAMRHRERFVNEVTGFHTQLTRQGHTVVSEVLVQRPVRAGARIAARLGLSPAADVIRIQRLRRVNGEIHHLAESYADAERFPGLMTADFTHDSLYAYLRARHDTLLARNQIVVGLHRTDDHEAQLLGLEPRSTVLLAESTVYDPLRKPLVYGTSKFPPSTAELSFDITADGN
ncbi:GntR family transcriptional regulator [Streptomyces sp. NPDC004111]|uniref:GntR family transcriptional regulator n=1 Tax=Streptomyces sp. NPDC004111 TaxID=3364690 RepID=UPI0036861E9A